MRNIFLSLPGRSFFYCFLLCFSAVDCASETSGYLAKSPKVMNGTWLQEYDFTHDGSLTKIERTNKICFTIEDENSFTGHYINIKHPNVYRGKIYTARTTSVINMIFASRDYYGVWSGKMVSARKIEGAWFDAAGNAGDFKLTKVD